MTRQKTQDMKITIRASTALRKLLEAEAARRGMNVSELMRYVLTQYFERQGAFDQGRENR